VKVANAAADLGMNVYGYDPYISVDSAWNIKRSIKHANDLRTIYENCDYITIHVPYTPETKHMINADAISHMREGVRIINLARGELVNDDDILDGIDRGRVACYVTDFPNSKLVGKPCVLCIPHLGASTGESEENCAAMAADELADYLLNGNIKNSVNMPTVELDRSGKVRLCIIHRNLPNILSSILSVISSLGLNIENLTNKSRGDYAYSIIDLNDNVSGEALETINSLENILRVRVL
jgi:D-3-phosphoglycerate dehydrogenase